MIYRLPIALIGFLSGGWMLFDGIHVMVWGKYFGPDKPGPWSMIFAVMGVNPFSLGPLFILLGTFWLIFLIALLCRQSWGWRGMVVMAVGSLWYLPVGTVMSAILLLLLFKGKSKLLG